MRLARSGNSPHRQVLCSPHRKMREENTLTRKAVGISLIGISASLYSARFLTAAIWGSGVSSWNGDLFRAMLQYTGSDLRTWAAVALLAGIAYLVWGELAERKPRSQK